MRTKLQLIVIFSVVLSTVDTYAQNLTGQQLLEKAIKYHDPNNSWSSFKGKLTLEFTTPDEKKRLSSITLNLPDDYFQLSSKKEDIIVIQTLNKGICEVVLDGKTTISEEDKKTHNLSCNRTKMYKDYYTYLYGLPMKLQDAGTIIHHKTEKRTFKGKEYLVLKVTYKEEVGSDIWYFYFDQKTYAMEVYQFFHDESKNDGEYIILNDEEEVLGIKIPKTRAWYYNKDDKHLGTDVLTKASSL